MIIRPEPRTLNIQSHKVIALEDGYIVRGHVSGLEAEHLIQMEHDPRFRLSDDSLEHVHMRAIPCQPGSDYDYRYEYSEPGRGAFPCSVIWL